MTNQNNSCGIKALGKGVVFQFNDRVNSKGEFEPPKLGQILLQSSGDDSAKSPRWITVLSVGDSCVDVQPGDVCLVPNLRWTNGVPFNDGKVWKTDETQIVAIRRDGRIKVLNEYCIFRQTPDKQTTSGGLILIEQLISDTPSGVVSLISDKCDHDLAGSTIYYNRNNFSDVFMLDSVKLAFIKQDDILAFIPADL